MPKNLDGIGACADEEQAAESTAAAAKPEKKRKDLPLPQIMMECDMLWGGGGFDDDQRGSSRVPGVSRSFDQRGQVSSCCGLRGYDGSSCFGGGGSDGSWAAGKCQPSLRKSSTIGSGLEPDQWPRGVGGVVGTQVCETQTTQVCEMISKEDDEEEEAPIAPLSPTQLLSKLLSEIDPRDLQASLAQALEANPDSYLQQSKLLAGFLIVLGSHLSGVSFRWDDIFKEPVCSKLFHDVIDVSHIPEAVYNITVEWINKHLHNYTLRNFVNWTFSYIIESVWNQCSKEGERGSPISNVAILVAAAMVLRSQPRILTQILGDLLRNQLWYEQKGALTTPLAVWMTSQVSQNDLLVGLKSWAYILLPLAIRSNDQTKDLILEFVENISKKPDVKTKLLSASALVPASSFEILLRLTFPAREEATTRRFAGIYPFLKDVALAGVPKRPTVNEEIFTFCLRLAQEGNTELAKEATEIATWCLTKHIDCWKHWEHLCKPENLETSVALLKRLAEKWEDHSLELSLLSSSDILALTKQWPKRNKKKKVSFTQTGVPPTSDEEAIQEVKIQQKAMEQEVKMAIEQYVKKAMEQYVKMQQEAIQEVKIQQEAMEQEVKLAMEQYVKKAMEQYVKMQQEAIIQEVKIQQEAMEQEVKMQQVKIFTQKIFTFSLRLAGKGNPVLAKEATEIAIWSLTENVVWWKVWENLYEENLEASVVILKTLVEKWKDHSLKLSTWSLNHSLACAPDNKAMKQFTQKIFTFSLRLAGEGNPDLAKEATEMAIWSLTENIDCWKYWDYLYKKNLEASVALLKKLVEKWKDRSLKPSSPSDTLEKIYTLSLRLVGEGNHVLAKEATEIAIWSLAEKDYLYKLNLKAVVALLKKPIDKWNDHSLKLLSSRSDTLTLSRTMKSFRLKNKNAITEGGAKASLYKEAHKSCKVIWGRLSRGSSNLKGTWIIGTWIAALVLVIAVAARTVYMF